MSAVRGILLALLLVAAAGCARQPEAEPMTAVPPPPDWRAAILAHREDRDWRFRLDPDTPLRPQDMPAFRGLTYWDPDPAYRLVGPLQRHAEPERFTIVTTSGQQRPCERHGAFTFDLRGRRCTLQVYRLLDSTPTGTAQDLFVPFTDVTTGTLTYPAGRYVDVQEQGSGTYVLDFNMAYNPLCAYGAPERYQCPVAPKENRLPVAVEAGERGWVHAP